MNSSAPYPSTGLGQVGGTLSLKWRTPAKPQQEGKTTSGKSVRIAPAVAKWFPVASRPAQVAPPESLNVPPDATPTLRQGDADAMRGAEVPPPTDTPISSLQSRARTALASLQNRQEGNSAASLQAQPRRQKRERESEAPQSQADISAIEESVKRGKCNREMDSKRLQENSSPATLAGITEPGNLGEFTLTPDRRTHICHGDKTGGGHMYSAKTVTTKFPKKWKEPDIEDAILAVLTKPLCVKPHESRNSRDDRTWAYYGKHRGVAMTVIVGDPSNRIITAYPGGRPYRR